MKQKKKDISRSSKYLIRIDQIIDEKHIFDNYTEDTKVDAMFLIRKKLVGHPNAKANLKTLKKNKKGYKDKSSWMFRRNKETGRHRLVKL